MEVKKFLALIFLIASFVILSACSVSDDKFNNTEVQNKIVSTANVIENESEVLEETDFYKITYADSMYQYYLFDENHNVVKSDGPLKLKPDIIVIDEHLVRFTTQSGTGIGTQWGYYYDGKKDVFSRVFNSIFDQHRELVAYRSNGGVIVRDIFDKTKFYQEISSFKEPFAETVDPIVKAEFSEDGKSIEITYLSGDDYKEVTEYAEIKN